MNARTCAMLVAAVLFASYGCSSSDGNGTDSTAGGDAPVADAGHEGLVNDAADGPTSGDAASGTPGPGKYVTDYKTSGDFFTRMTQPASSGSVHGKVRIWYSKNVMGLPTSGPFTAPVGTVAIKEEYNGSGGVLIKVVMIKKPRGYDSANHDWYYEARNADDTQASDPVPGKPSLCIGCHVNAAATTDYLQGFALSN